jgi:hypothetical protein
MLIIFVDALPHLVAKKFQSLNKVSVSPLTPGYGYSVNLHAELFAGVTPDEAGYFGELLYGKRTQKLGPIWGLLAKLELRFAGFARLIRLFFNIITRRRVGYIPLAFKGIFSKKGVYPLVHPTEFESIFDKIEFSKHIADKVRAPLGEKDNIVFTTAFDMVAKGQKHIFISMCDLDGMYHEYGESHDKIHKKLDWLDSKIGLIWKEYNKLNPEEPIFLLSDHGISNAPKHVTFNYQKYSNEILNGELIVFFDSLYLAFWADSDDLTNKVLNDLHELPGKLLSEEHRISRGLTDKRFGDHIFLLTEGYGFCPNFFGFRPLKSYHGYDPDLPKSKGVIATNVEIKSEIKNLDVYQLLSKPY